MSLILIIDDAAIIRQPIELALKAAGYETVSAENGLEGLARMSSRKPDLILLDVSMPVMDGISFLERVRQDPKTKDVPVIMLTATGDKKLVVRALKLGISSFLLKSNFGLEILLEQVKAHLVGAVAGSSAAPGEGAPATVERGTPERSSDAPAPKGSAGARGPGGAAAPASAGVRGVAASVKIPGAARAGGGGAAAPMGAERITAAKEVAAQWEARSAVSGEEPSERLRSLKPLMTRTEVADRINGCEQLHAFSPTVSQLLKMLSNPSTSIERVVKIVGQDHAIALKILRMSNSVAYSRGEPVDSVHKAVLRIGLERIRQAVLNIGVVEQFAESKAGERLSLVHFWEHAIGVGLAAAAIAAHMENVDPDAAFTMGLLHDVGRVILLEQFGDVYEVVVRTARELELPLEQVESRMLLVNHADVMDRVLHSWKFARQLVNPIVFHHLSAGNIRKVAPRETEQVGILALANRMAHAMMLGTSGNEVVYPTDDLCQLLRLDGKKFQQIAEIVPGQTDDMKIAMLAMTRGAAWDKMTDRYRARLAGPVRPLFMSATPETDAYRLFIERLGERGVDEPPNVGVVHIGAARDSVMMTERYKRAESAAGVAELPLLIISPMAKIRLEERFLASRRHRMVTSPAVVTKLLTALNELIGVAGEAPKAAEAA